MNPLIITEVEFLEIVEMLEIVINQELNQELYCLEGVESGVVLFSRS